MSSVDDYDDPDDYLDEDDDYGGSDDWRQGECDHCYGETVHGGPFGPIYCACAIGQGASEDDCVCGPPTEVTA